MPIRLLGLMAAAGLALGCAPNSKTHVMVGPMTMQMRHGQLPSGARIIFDEARGTGASSVVLLVDAGAKLDPPGKEGLAHLVQHLSFRSKPAGKVTQEQGFALLGASTIHGETHVTDSRFQVLTQARLTQNVVSLLAQQLEHPLDNISAEVFEAERDAAADELRDHTDDGYPGEALTALQRLLYPPEHPLSRPLRGTVGSLSRITLEDAQAFAKAYYRTGGATLVVTGDFDSGELEKQVLESLPAAWTTAGPRAATLKVDAEPPAPPPAPEKLTVVDGAVVRSEVVLSWSLPAAQKLVVPPSYLEATLEQALNFDFDNHAPDVDQVSCDVALDPVSSMMRCVAPLRTGVNPEQSLEALYKRVGSGWYKSMHIRVWTVAQTYVDQLFREEGLSTRAVERAESWHYTDDPQALSKRLDLLKNRDDDSLFEISDRYLGRDRMRAVLVQPALSAPTGRSNGFSDPPLSVQVPAQTLREEAEGPMLGGMRTFALSNGLQVLVVPRPAMPVATVTLALPGGHGRGARGAAHWAGLLSSADHSPTAGVVTTSHQADVTVVRLRGANGNLDSLLDNLHLWLVRETSTEAQTRLRKARDLGVDKVVLDDEDAAASAFAGALYRGTRFDPSFDQEALRHLELADVKAWRAGAFQPGKAVLIISGDIDPMKMRDLTEEYLGSWKGDGEPQPLPALPSFEPKPIVVQVNARPGSSLTRLTLGCLVPAPEAKDALAPDVLGAAIDSRLTRLWQTELRAAYRVSTQVEDDGPLSTVVTTARLDPTRLAPALTALKAQWDAHELPDPDATLARWTVARLRSTSGSNSQALPLYFATSAVRSHAQLDAVEQEHQLAEFSTGLVQREFETCRGTSVLRLDGDAERIKQALHDAGF